MIAPRYASAWIARALVVGAVLLALVAAGCAAEDDIFQKSNDEQSAEAWAQDICSAGEHGGIAAFTHPTAHEPARVICADGANFTKEKE